MKSVLMRVAAKEVASRCNVDLGEQKAYAMLRYANVMIGKTVEPYQQYRKYFYCKSIQYDTGCGPMHRLQTEVLVPEGVDFIERVVKKLIERGEFDRAINYMRKNAKK
jgi:hypothetical protein